MVETKFAQKLGKSFVVNVEAVPPAGRDCAQMAAKIAAALNDQPIDAINLADSPMASPRMSPSLFAGALRAAVPAELEIIPHVTVRDRNCVALQGLLWGIAGLGISTILAVSGDPVQYSSDPRARHVGHLSVSELVGMAREAGLRVGVVLDPRPALRERELRKLEKKISAGAQFVITQPLYAIHELEVLAADLASLGAPALLGILPLVSVRHARFLDEKVPGISVPASLLSQMERAGEDALAIGIANARQMLAGAREWMAGACLMPPFGRFNLVSAVLG
jgi:methylenetetrahydrofolate reductase (NADPH)